MTSNVIEDRRYDLPERLSDLAICQAAAATPSYSSSMCSKACPVAAGPPPSSDLAARLGSAIDELAAAADAGTAESGGEIAARLAAAWAIVTDADPELAERTARYSH